MIASWLASLTALLTDTSALAATADLNPNLPQHDLVCANGIVAKRQLATWLLVNNKNTDAILAVSRGPELWHTIFTDPKFCHVPPSCTKNPNTDACKAAAKCVGYQNQAIYGATNFFIALDDERNDPHRFYTESANLRNAPDNGAQVSLYFQDSNDEDNKISCTKEPTPAPPQAFDPTKDPVLSKIRVRGLSDDLNIDRNDPRFKGTTSATGSYSANTAATHTFTTIATGAVGYAFDTIPQTQIVPYLSFFQSVTNIVGKATNNDPNNYVAGGILFQHYFDYEGVTHEFSIKPQYLTDTTTEARLVSARAIYTPSLNIPFNLNSFRQLSFLPGSPWGEIVFNLRSDAGSYSNRGNTPAVVAVNQDYERVGTQVGVTLSTDASAGMPSFTWIATETYLYGVSGFYRHLDLFQTSLTYNFPNSYLGLTASYKHGRDEDTAVASQIYTLGLSAHY
jgi:hypothetical protein